MIFIPVPNKGESEKDFIKRCIPYVIKEGKEADQASAICHSIWKRKHEQGVDKIDKERVYLCLSAELNCFYDLEKDKSELEVDTCTILVGDGYYNGIYFPKEELGKNFMNWDKVPINLNHSDDKIEDIVGFIENPQFDGHKLTVTPVFSEETVKYDAAMGFIKSRIKASRVPNVSVGVWLDRVVEEMDEGETRITARNLEPDHLALVVQGACSPESGCGIGLSENNPITIQLSENVEVDSDGNISIDILSDEYVDKDEIYKLKKEILKEKIKEEKLK